MKKKQKTHTLILSPSEQTATMDVSLDLYHVLTPGLPGYSSTSETGCGKSVCKVSSECWGKLRQIQRASLRHQVWVQEEAVPSPSSAQSKAGFWYQGPVLGDVSTHAMFRTQ